MSLSEAETTWMSRIAMNIPNTMMRNAISRRGAMRSAGALGARIVADGAVVAVAMSCSGQAGAPVAEPARYKLLRMNHGRRIEVRFGVGVLGPLGGIDGRIDRHAGAQQAFARDVRRHPDPDRQPLHDLGEIAGGVVRRQ